MTTSQPRPTTFWEEIADLPHTLEYLQVGEWRTRVFTAGEGPETIVMLAGTSGHIEAFARNIRALAAQHRVVAYDFPGHGYTTHATADLEMPQYIEHLRGLLDVLDLEAPIICGESLGGWVAVKFAGVYPERVGRLILSAPGGHMFPEDRLKFLRELNERVAADPRWDDVKARLEVVMHDPGQVTEELIAVRQNIYAQKTFPESMHRIMCLHDPEIRYRNRLQDAELAALACPTLFVWTGHEPAGRERGAELAALIPRGEFFLIEDAEHWPQWEDAAAFNERVLRFVAETAASEASA